MMSDPEQTRMIEIDALAARLQARLSASELEELRPGHFRVESRYCGCADRSGPLCADTARWKG
jgi:hypothetical protein